MPEEIKVVQTLKNAVEFASGNMRVRVYHRLQNNKAVIAGGLIWDKLSGKQIPKAKDSEAARFATASIKQAHRIFNKKDGGN